MVSAEGQPEGEAERGEDGVDATLIRAFLELSPAERLEQCARWAADIRAMRQALHGGADDGS